MNRVLIIAAHPDDELLGCGATISKYSRRGAVFKVLFIAEGSSCRYDSSDRVEAIEAIAKRTQQSITALGLLGITNYEFYDLPCGRLDMVPIIEINKIIEHEVYIFKPDTVLTHACHDANNDHRIVQRATMMATRPIGNSRVLRVLSYEVLSSSEWSYGETFVPTSFEQIEEYDLDCKCQAMKAYETEVKDYPFPRSEHGLRALAMNRGMQAGVPLAEAFHLIREFRE
jgi:LmbE family N-acetylglucosaminyl deacetylase